MKYDHAAVMAAIKKTCEEWLAKNWPPKLNDVKPEEWDKVTK